MVFFKKALFSLIPVLLLAGVVEGGLWLAGAEPASLRDDPYVGFAAEIPLFVRQRDERGQAILRTASVKRAFFNDQRFDLEKPRGTRRVFCVGGSTTYGRPYRDATSFCGWLRESLRVVAPETNWEVVNAGGISYASYRVAALMRELVRYEPDLFVVYSGHNEFLEERTYRALRNRPAALRWLDLKLRRTRSYAALARLLSPTGGRAGAAPGRDQLSAEVETRLDASVGPSAYHRDDALAEAVMEHYRLNLHRMANLAHRVGAEIALVVPADNLRDCSPFRSQPSASLSPADKHSFATLLESARRHLEAREWSAAQAAFRAAVDIDPRHAAARYGLGQTLVALGELEAATRQLARARDEDVCPLRAISAVAATVREVASQGGLPLVDFPRRIAETSGPGAAPPGDDWFLDHVHPTIEGNRLLAREILSVLVDAGWLAANLETHAEQLAAMAERVRGGLDPRQHGIALRNLAKVLSWAGKTDDAARLARRALEKLGDDAESLFILAVGASERGEDARAVAFLREALRIDPDWIKARHNLAVELSRSGRPAEALAVYDEVLRRAPDHPSARFNRARALVALGRVDAAIDGYRDALRQDPDDADARFNLASAYESAGRPRLARAELESLLALDPDDLDARNRFERLAAATP